MSIWLYQDIENVKKLHDCLRETINRFSDGTDFPTFQREDFNRQLQELIDAMQKMVTLCAKRLENYEDQDE